MAFERVVSREEKVKNFHRAFGLPIKEYPQIPETKRISLRVKLLREEFHETIEAIYENPHTNAVHTKLSKLAKELADLLYVTYGMAIEFGIPLDDVFDEVHRSNMSKLDADGKPIYREDGKVLKGPRYFEPNIRKVIGVSNGEAAEN